MALPKPPPLTAEQKRKLLAKTKPVIKAIGDKMAASKRPFWRGLVAFFRGE